MLLRYHLYQWLASKLSGLGNGCQGNLPPDNCHADFSDLPLTKRRSGPTSSALARGEC